MKPFGKEKIRENLEIIGFQISKYRKLMIVISAVLAAIALFFVIYWNVDETTAGKLSDAMYLFAYIFFLVLSVSVCLMLLFGKKLNLSTKITAIIIHIYVTLLIAWGTLVCILDLDIGASPILYLIVLTFLSGLFVVEPFYFAFLTLCSFTVIMVFTGQHDYSFFYNEFGIESIMLFFIYLVVVVLCSFRHFTITILEHKQHAELTKLTYYDQLTDLLNERSYLEEVNKISDQVEKGNVEKFAVILMDLNNLKVTNDAYGHRYGCHLVVKCGHTLPTLFTSSKLFHIGGDEFVAIVRGKDLENIEALITRLKLVLEYSKIEYEGKELIFSVANGYSIYRDGEKYQDVLQRADDEMYKNKKYLKEKHDMKIR